MMTRDRVRSRMKTGAAGRGFEPCNPGYDPDTLSTRLSSPRATGTVLELAIHPSIDLDHKGGGVTRDT